MEVSMKNLMSHNQMAQWTHHEGAEESLHYDSNVLMDDYFDCLIDCEDNENECRMVCSEILRNPV